ncbi:MAG: HAD-IIIA family hydrolase [Treponema sp.]|nr:HAD-IIIA family hydrolase [Treponema sp.]
MTDLYIFDLDGTLIDSGEDIADCVNATFEHFGYFKVDVNDLISFTGDGARKLVRRALKSSTRNKFDETTESGAKKFEEIMKWYLEYYYSHPITKTTLFAGTKELLRVLKSKGKKVAVLTNKPGKIADVILEKLNVREYIDVLVSPDDYEKKKPDPKAIEFVVSKINEKFGISLAKENVIMIGDSNVDIDCGKAYGCKTVGCRSGLGNTDELLKAKPDLSFSVAAEIEKFIDVLSENSDVSEIQKFAMENEVPILQDEGSEFICEYIKKNNVKSILEIGTAIGFSSIRFAKLNPEIRVTTIEIDEKRHETAKKNVESENLSDRIELILGNALETEIDKKFDLVFIDAAKAQYIKFFEKYKSNLNDGGVIVSDNLSFHGMVEDLSLTRNYSTIKLVKKIRKYIEFLKTNEEFDTEFFKIGDGVSVSRRKRKTEN